MSLTWIILIALAALVLVAAMIEAYVKRQRKRPFASSQPQYPRKLAPGQFATETTILQDMLEDRQRRKEAQTLKETRQ